MNTGGNPDVKFYSGKASYSTDTWCFTAKDNLEDYLYLFLEMIKPELGVRYFIGTGLRHLQKPLLLKKELYIPNQRELSRFNKVVKPALTLVSENIKENHRLLSILDDLLPLFMNGQLRLKTTA